MEQRTDANADARVERAVVLDVDIDTAWELVTSPHDLEHWLGSEVTLDAVPGAEGEVVDHDGTVRRVVVDEVERNARIAWRWWPSGTDQAGPDQAGPGRVEITLVPVPGGTRIGVTEVPLTHTGRVRAEVRTGVATTCSFTWWQRLAALEITRFRVTLLARTGVW